MGPGNKNPLRERKKKERKKENERKKELFTFEIKCLFFMIGMYFCYNKCQFYLVFVL